MTVAYLGRLLSVQIVCESCCVQHFVEHGEFL